jgi:hypothetical protein
MLNASFSDFGPAADMERMPRLDDGEGVHSGLTLAALMMGHHFSISAF